MKIHPIFTDFLMAMIFLVYATNSFAENQPHPWKYQAEIFGSVGWGSFYHGNHKYGGGFNWSGGLGVRPFSGALRGLGFEGEINGLHFAGRTGTDYESKGDRTVLSANVLYHFGRAGTQFFLLGGIGSLKAHYHYQVPGYLYQDEGRKMSLNLGAGVKIRLASHFSIRPEFRLFDTTVGSGYNWSSPQFSCGVSYHW